MSADQAATQDDGYKAKNFSVEEMANADKGDKSLDAYKASLIGGALDSSGKAVAKFPLDKRKVIVESVKIVFDDDKAPTRELTLQVDKADQTVIIKEGATFTVWVSFYVQHDIALGLKLTNATSKLGITVDTESAMLGSFAPKLEAYDIRATVHEAPTGFLARTSYNLRSILSDDDGNTHNTFNCTIQIKSSWT